MRFRRFKPDRRRAPGALRAGGSGLP
ncbi:hypothetical protein SAMN05428979_2272 [Stappia sp. ES.058]|nr:hypothetical protein SAMN05428979_2272 [Stappia sp. ES.058]